MSEKIKSLWPSEFPKLDIVPPVVILRQQAYLLGESTNNIVEGMVISEAKGSAIHHKLFLRASSLGTRVELLEINHEIKNISHVYISSVGGIDYPDIVQSLQAKGIRIANQSPPPQFYQVEMKDFEKALGVILSSNHTLAIISSLITQSLDPAA